MLAKFDHLAPSELILMHDNARPHVAQIVKTWFNDQGIVLLPQPPYSPDVNLMDRFVFRNFEVFRTKVLDSADEVRETISEFLSSLKANDFHSQFDHLKQDLLNIISNDGNYI